MMKVILTLTMLALALSGAARAEVAGRFIQAEGQVELLKGGKPPAQPAKVDDGVEPGDAVHTKDLSRAQVKLLDDSILTIAPNSQIIIEEYLYEAAKNQRRASIQVLQGLMQAVVTRLFPGKEPDFLVKTPDAVMGVRGTEWYVLKGADTDFTDAFVKTGKILVQTAAPSLGGLGPEGPFPLASTANLADGFSKTSKIAFATPDPSRIAQRERVTLGSMQTNRTIKNQFPTQPTNFTLAELRLLNRLIGVGLPSRLGPSTNPRNLLQQLRLFIERQESVRGTGKGDKSQELAKNIKDALAKGDDLSTIMRDLMTKGEKVGEIMAAAAEVGVKDTGAIANAAMAAWANLADVRAALGAMGYAGASTYAYTPPGPPPPPPGAGTTFPGGGGGGGGEGGGGGVGSPSR